LTNAPPFIPYAGDILTMKKRSYRAQKVNEVRWEGVADRVKERAVVWAIDVAKIEQYGILMDSKREVMVTVKWAHPAETPALLERRMGLAGGSLTAVMESNGVYGDTLRRPLRETGIAVYRFRSLGSARPRRLAIKVKDKAECRGMKKQMDCPAARSAANLQGGNRARIWVV
jgi:hypothetical protein